MSPAQWGDSRRMEKLESRIAELEVMVQRKVAALPTEGLPGGLCVMTLRDYFAGIALSKCVDEFWGEEGSQERMAKCAYQIADTMLWAREAKP